MIRRPRANLGVPSGNPSNRRHGKNPARGVDCFPAGRRGRDRGPGSALIPCVVVVCEGFRWFTVVLYFREACSSTGWVRNDMEYTGSSADDSQPLLYTLLVDPVSAYAVGTLPEQTRHKVSESPRNTARRVVSF